MRSETHRRMPCDDRSREWKDDAANEGMPRMNGNRWELGRGEEGVSSEAQRERGPAACQSGTLASEL